MWTDVFLGAFLVGLCATLGMLVLGGAGHTLHGGHVHAHGGHGHGHGHGHAQAADPTFGGVLLGALVGLLNVTAWLAALMAGGAAGYVTLRLGRSHTVVILVALAFAVLGAFCVSLAIRLLSRAEAGVVTGVDPTGTTARVIAAIAPGAIGEIVFTQSGTRRAMPARLDDGTARIERDGEVVIMRVERGVAYVRSASALYDPADPQNQK